MGYRIKDFVVITFILFPIIIRAHDYPFYNDFGVLTISTYQCLKQQGYPKVGVWIQSLPEGIDYRQVLKVSNAANAQIQPQLVFQPCRSRTAKQQAQLIMQNFGTMVNKLWLFPYHDSTTRACGWKNDTSNCQYLLQLLTQFKKFGKQVGIYSTRPAWNYYFSSSQNCPEATQYPLFWFPTGNGIDLKPNFDSYSLDKVGEWTQPYMKRYVHYIICGAVIQVCYYA